MLTHSGLDHLRFASLSHVDDLPFIISQRNDFWHLQAPFNKSKPKTTLTVETTIVLLICDKNCQNLYKSVPIFMSFTSHQVSFPYFHFDLTFLQYVSFWGASRRILCILPSSWTNVKDPGNITHLDSSVVSLPLNDKLTQTPHSER